MPEEEFNLLYEPWILVMKPDGEPDEVNLLDLFRRAPEFKGLAGELPTQDVAVLRLLLAVLHAVFGRYDPDGNLYPIKSPGDALERWKSLWDRGAFPMKIIEDYLKHFEERFYLFHPKRPFYQVAFTGQVRDAQGTRIKPTEKGAGSFIGDIAQSEHQIRLFSGRTQNDSVSYSEAARWLVYTNSFDVAPGGNPGRNGICIKGYGLAWLSKLGLVWAVGSNLFETLMLNFVLATKEKIWTGDQNAYWEQDGICEAKDLLDIMPAFPKTPCELLTTQFRRIQLVRDSERKRVTKYLLWSGQSLETKDAFMEHMTLWKKTDDGYVPKMHDPSRQIWRDFSAILSGASGKNPSPGIVNWIAWLKNNNLLQLPIIQLNTVGVDYKQNTAIINVFSDSLHVNLSLLSALGEDWVNLIINEIDTTDKLVEQAGRLAQNLAKAAGDRDGSDQKSAAKEQAYFRLDAPFRRWLEEIDPERDNDRKSEVCNEWWEQAKRIVCRLGRELVEQSGPRAFVGRMLTENKRENRYNAPEAYNRFLYFTSSRDALKGGGKNDRRSKTG